MAALFPPGTGIGRIRGIIDLIKRNGGAIELSELATEAGEQIDDLLPLVEACKLLGFTTVKDSTIKLTKQGSKMTVSNSSKMIRDGLTRVEPFKSTLDILNKNYATSKELVDLLYAKGIFVHGDVETNRQLLKKMLLRFGVRANLISYDPKKDEWSVNSD